MKAKLQLAGFDILGRLFLIVAVGILCFGVLAALVARVDASADTGFWLFVSHNAMPIVSLSLIAIASAALALKFLMRARELDSDMREELRARSKEKYALKRASQKVNSAENNFGHNGKNEVAQAGSAVSAMRYASSVRTEDRYPAYWPELRQVVLDRDGYRCGNCGGSEDLHIHHIIPLSLGGSNEMGNLRTLCRSCHARLHPHMRDA